MMDAVVMILMARSSSLAHASGYNFCPVFSSQRRSKTWLAQRQNNRAGACLLRRLGGRASQLLGTGLVLLGEFGLA